MTSPSKEQSTYTEENLALSELHILLEALEKEHQWLLKQIKRKRNELNNFVEQMRSVATQTFHQGTPLFKKLIEIDQEIHTLFEQIFNGRKLSKKNREHIRQIYENLQFIGLVSPKSLDEEEEESPELDQLFENQEEPENFFDNFAGSSREERQDFFSEPTRTKDSKKIRQTFLRLAEIFHPDKVNDSETQMRHTEIMKEINRAYQQGDLARLLEIEQQYNAGEIIDSNSESDLSRECKKLEQHNEFLKTQYENLKRELRLVKNTPEGAMVADYRKAAKTGIDPIKKMFTEVEEQMEILEEVRDFVKKFCDKKVNLNEFMRGPDCLRNMRQSAMEKLLEEILYSQSI